MGAKRNFRQNDLTRAIRAAKAAGIQPHVWIDRSGELHIREDNNLALPTHIEQPIGEPSPWDVLLSDDQA